MGNILSPQPSIIGLISYMKKRLIATVRAKRVRRWAIKRESI